MNYIYTAIFDGYDELKEINLMPGWEAICFSNVDIKSESWKIVKIEKSDKIFRQIKIQPDKFLPPHEKSIWIDGNLEMLYPLKWFAKRNGLWMMRHPDRDCIYKEAQACIELKKDREEIIRDQVDHYRAVGYPENNGLIATGVIVRTNDERNRELGEKWWAEVQKYSVRDQLSFNYVAWLMNLEFKVFGFLEGFRYHYHLHKRKFKRKFRRTKRVQGIKYLP